jgi:hypothetical protein
MYMNLFHSIGAKGLFKERLWTPAHVQREYLKISEV